MVLQDLYFKERYASVVNPEISNLFTFSELKTCI